MRGTLLILLFFVIGLLLSYLNFLPQDILDNDYSKYALFVLMFLVGISVGADSLALSIIKTVKFKILLVPLCTIVGTFAGMILIYPFLSDFGFAHIQAVGAGYGYYSLSSIIISEINPGELGVIALLANIIREIITLLFTPVIFKFFGSIAPISSGGATSMDTTLPIITKYVGKEYALISIFHGTILTILVPIIVSLFMM